jgi:predicted heme/steroid binding protein
MRYLSEDEATRMMGLGYVGELYEDLDGNLYGWVEGADEFGDPVGSLQELYEPEAPALGGELGALYAAPDGTVYQVQGFAEDEATATEDSGDSQTPVTEAPSESQSPQETRPGPRLHPRARARHMHRGPPARRHGQSMHGRPPRKKGGLLKKLLPIAKFATRFIPGVGPVVSAGIDVADKLLRKPGVAGYDGLGALYAAPDGTVYQVQGLEEVNLDGLYADEELHGFAEDEAFRGFADDDELRGFAEDDELRGYVQEPDLRGFADDELRGLEQSYVRDDNVSGMEAYVPVKPPQTRWLTPLTEQQGVWEPLW